MKGTIAIIPARGGSKRIPKKNIRQFCGKPIISYSIEAALEADIFDEVMVSTDSEEIAELALKYGASVPFMRSEKTAGDYATTSEVVLEVIDNYKKLGKEFQYAACIYAAAPFVTSDKLCSAMKKLKENDVVEIMPVVQFSYPPMRGFIMKDDYLAMKWPEFLNTRSQDIESLYHDCGQFYCYDIEKYQSLNGQIVDSIMPIIVSESEVQDIDSEEDWKIAEIKYQIMKGLNRER